MDADEVARARKLDGQPRKRKDFTKVPCLRETSPQLGTKEFATGCKRPAREITCPIS